MKQPFIYACVATLSLAHADELASLADWSDGEAIPASSGDADLGTQVLLGTRDQPWNLSGRVATEIYWTNDMTGPLLFEEENDLPVREIYLKTAGPTPIDGLDKQSGFFGVVDVSVDFDYGVTDRLHFFSHARSVYTTDFIDDEGREASRILVKDFQDANFTFLKLDVGASYELWRPWNVRVAGSYELTDFSREFFSENQLRSSHFRVGLEATPWKTDRDRVRVVLSYANTLATSGISDDADEDVFRPEEYSIGVTWTRQLQPDLLFDLGVQYRIDDYLDELDRGNEDFFISRAQLTWLLTEHLSVYAMATYGNQRSSSLDVNIVNRETFMTGLGVEFRADF